MAPRRSRGARRSQNPKKRLAAALASALAAALLCVLTLAVPGFGQWLFRLTGVTPAASVPAAGQNSPVAVHFIDVGQGTATLVEDGGEFALIDGGPPDAAEALTAYLRAAGVSRLRYMVLTHPHADHYGGMRAVAESFEVQQMVLPALEKAPYPTAVTFLDLLETLAARGVAASEAAEGGIYPLGQGELRVLHAGLETSDNYNLLSLTLLYSGGGLRCLITGDGEAANEKSLLESGADLRADVFSAAHHGSSTSNGEDFLLAVAPQAVTVSCGAANSYGHPHRSALKAYEAAGARVYRTDKDGSVVAYLQAGRVAIATAGAGA